MAVTRRIVLSFDMEPDVGSWTSGTRGITEGTPEILRVMAEHGATGTFLFVGREAEQHPEAVHAVLAAGHEVGCHTMFHETVGRPVYDVPVGGFILDEEIPRRLALATEAIERVSGVRPVSFRAPRLFGSGAMLAALEDLGYLVDSSFPAYFHGRDFRPYHPDRNDWTQTGDLKLLEVPVFYDTEADSGGAAQRGRDQWPALRTRGAAYFTDLARRMFDRLEARGDDPVLCVYLHPWEFVSMPASVHTDESTITFAPFLYTHTGPDALHALSGFLGAMREDGVRFVRLRTLGEEARKE